MKFELHVWPQDRLDKEMKAYRVDVVAPDGVKSGDIMLTREEAKAWRDGKVTFEVVYPEGGVRL